jgi:hypothetical protein
MDISSLPFPLSAVARSPAIRRDDHARKTELSHLARGGAEGKAKRWGTPPFFLRPAVPRVQANGRPLSWSPVSFLACRLPRPQAARTGQRATAQLVARLVPGLPPAATAGRAYRPTGDRSAGRPSRSWPAACRDRRPRVQANGRPLSWSPVSFLACRLPRPQAARTGQRATAQLVARLVPGLPPAATAGRAYRPTGDRSAGRPSRSWPAACRDRRPRVQANGRPLSWSPVSFLACRLSGLRPYDETGLIVFRARTFCVQTNYPARV